MASISLGEYQEEVWCDVLLMDTCHVCLGGPWFQRYEIPYEQEWHKYVMDERRKHLFPYVLHPNVRWPILIMEASGEEYVKWEFMMEEIFASYPYSQERKMKLAIGTFEKKLAHYWAYKRGNPITTWDVMKESLRGHYPEPHEKGYRSKTTSQEKRSKGKKQSPTCEMPQIQHIPSPIKTPSEIWAALKRKWLKGGTADKTINSHGQMSFPLVSHGKENPLHENQGKITYPNTLTLLIDINANLSMKVSLPCIEPSESLPCLDNVIVKSDDMTIESDEPSGVFGNVERLVSFGDYNVICNPLWDEDTLSHDGDLLLRNCDPFVGKESVTKEGDSCLEIVNSSFHAQLHSSPLDNLVLEPYGEVTLGSDIDEEVILRDTFLYYLFAYDDILEHIGSASYVGEGFYDLADCVLHHTRWMFVPFDPGDT
ncbi:uncharacterized protein LOC132046020 [Lycium ferocissimum]|uniref:uncharacterized protein LOC132046020 n=1 Tax=Lycium ferocissimum TaxID=112874 RepID=UPI002815A205|nr:uncharacterized protein LOC132046020 [Lycium ferocissimum]